MVVPLPVSNSLIRSRRSFATGRVLSSIVNVNKRDSLSAVFLSNGRNDLSMRNPSSYPTKDIAKARSATLKNRVSTALLGVLLLLACGIAYSSGLIAS